MIEIETKLYGGLFHKDIPRSVRDAGREEVVTKITARWMRRRRRPGVQRNPLVERTEGLEGSVRMAGARWRYPRRTGSKWKGSLIAAAKSMAPRVLNKWARTVAAEMGRG